MSLFTDIQPLPESEEILAEAVATHKPDYVVGCLSGGYDSMSATKIASRHPLFIGAFHANTGIGVPAARRHVRLLCKAQGWKLFEYHARKNRDAEGNLDPQLYEDIVKKYGFPGPGVHSRMYARLKQRAFRHFQRDIGGRVLFVTGIRKYESRRRMPLKHPHQWVDGCGWANPIFYWNCDQPAIFCIENGLPQNPVKNAIGISGECLCGAFAQPGELELIKKHFPHTYRRIRKLEKEVEALGEWCRWGSGGPPATRTAEKRGQTVFMPFCVGCEARESHA